MQLDKQALADFEAHVIRDYPREACGLVVDGSYLPCANVSDDPCNQFRIDPDEYLRVEQDGRTVNAVLHSHPYSLLDRTKWDHSWPSTHDMSCYLAGNVPWGIVSTDGAGISPVVWLEDGEVPPLVGREFIHGVQDCYSLVRDWYRLNWNVRLNNYARQVEWWVTGEDLYSQNFASEGFYEVRAGEATVGDAVLLQVAAKVVNHAGVITGTNQLLHHLYHRQSGYDSLAKWHRHVKKFLRYGGRPA